ncbi:MAG: GNAT family N-acetyltransferase [Gammaproteobacteria bacterium HGW-Gammaproteobacteria-14]|nr:MAG: GNAT family N-acetyltransferase [Gammaproteobacteria bacterium HGW-Gammaproteobacteria-14]
MLKHVMRLFGKPRGEDRSAMLTPVQNAPAQNAPVADVPVLENPSFDAVPVDTAITDDFVMPFEIRPLLASDSESLRAVFRQSILINAADHYPADALAAWSASADAANFIDDLQQGVTIVAALHGQPVGFAQLSPSDHIEKLFIAPEGNGLGIATLLCQHLEDEARMAGAKILRTESSLPARRFFEGMGFTVVEEETAYRQDIPLQRFRMEKILVR